MAKIPSCMFGLDCLVSLVGSCARLLIQEWLSFLSPDSFIRI